MQIAIVAVELRLPGGVAELDAWERSLRAAVPAIGPPPPARRMRGALQAAGWLDGVERFAADAFGVSHGEAAAMDPQHRLLWTAARRAVERWGRGLPSLAGRPIGVWTATGLPDWSERTRTAERADAWSGTGSLPSVAAGRIAHAWDLHGPAVSVDTACSSGLVALHDAVTAIRQGRVEAAIVGGANLILSAAPTRAFARLGALSPTGRSRPFDVAADGYVRAEAVVVAILRPLEAAIADGDPVLAIVRGVAVNHDGRTHALTAPSGSAQQAVLRAALHDADLAPSALGLVEAHGTGTPLGDPIEAAALDAVLETEGPPVAVGATKAVIGHSEPVSGLVGLAAAVVRLRTGRADAIADLNTPNPRIAPSARLRLPVAPMPIASPFAAVQAFGLSGTNASVILGSGHPFAPASARRGVTVAMWSAPTQSESGAVAAVAAEQREPWADAAAAATARADGPWRAFAVGDRRPSAEALVLRAGEAVRAPSSPAPITWVFTGQGAVRPGMALALAEAEPLFARALDRLAPSFAEATGRDLRTALADDGVVHTALAQPSLAAVQIALAAALAELGLRPDAVVGHSVGEIAALVAAGAIDAEDAVRFAARRGAAMGGLPSGGAMAAVFASREDVGEPEGVVVAAHNAPRQIVLSGPTAAIEAARAALSARGIASAPLAVSHAFHSPLMQPAADAIDRAARDLPIRTPAIPVYTSLTGARAGAWVTSPEWWREAALRPVRFADALRAAAADGMAHFLEVGPSPQLRGPGLETLPAATWIPTLEPSSDDASAWLTAIGRLWQQGHAIRADRLVGRAHPEAWPPAPLRGDPHWVASDEETRAEARVAIPVAVDGVDDGAPWRVDGVGPLADRLRAALPTDGAAPRSIRVLGDEPIPPPPSEGPVLWVVAAGDPRAAGLAAAVRCRRAEGGPELGVLTVAQDAPDSALGRALGVAADGAQVSSTGIEAIRLETATVDTPQTPEAALVTGVGGAIGQGLVRALRARGTRRIVGLARRPVSIEGVDVVVGDAADPDAVAEAWRRLGPGGVAFHLAGSAPHGDHPVDAAALRRVRMTALDVLGAAGARVVATSSVSAVWGAAGLTAYAAVSAEVAARASDDVRIVALGPVRGGMMAGADLDEAARVGLYSLTADEAGDALIDALVGPAFRVVGAWDWERFCATASLRGPRTLFGALPAAAPTPSRGTFDAVARSVLGRAPDPDRGWFDQGLDSVGAVELAARLAAALGRPVPPTAALDHGTPRLLAAWLEDAIAAPAAPAVPAQAREVAICGMAARLPGAHDLDALWDRLCSGRPAFGPVPADRDWPSPPPGAPMGRRTGAFLDDLFSFDADAYGLTVREAEAMDPQHRLLLDLAVDALADAGLRPTDVLGTRTGVWVGIGRSEYWERLRDPDAATWATSGTGNEPSFAAGRLAWWLGTRGPAMAVNTACSSALVAIHLAVRALRAGEVDRAIVAGVQALLDPADQDWVADSGALSPSGRCQPFSAGADGYVRGEGGGAVVLARSADAVAAGMPIRARIAGSAVNHDGRGPGLTAPSGEAQRALLRDALADAGASAEDVVAVEAHGTGTPLGDPVEAGALRDVFGNRPIPVASVKGLVGHLETGAGMASIARVVVSLRRGLFAPASTVAERNPALGDWRARFPTAAEPLGDGLYAISGFGMSGTNAHVLLRRGHEDGGAPLPTPTRHRRILRAPRRGGGLPLWAESGAGTPPACDPDEAVRLAATLATARGRLTVAGSDAFTRALVATARAERPDLRVDGPPGRPLRRLNPSQGSALSGTWVVTGAAGAIGRLVVAWLVAQGAERVVAVCRHPPAAPIDGAVLLLADAGDADAIARVVSAPAGIVACAGVASDGLLGSLTAASLAAARAPKAIAAERLARRFPGARHVWFGSAVTRRGRAGAGAYAAANAELEDLAHRLRASGVAATAIAWGPWAGTGMAAGRAGWGDVRPHSAAGGLAALGAVLGTTEAVVVAMDGPVEDPQPPSVRAPVTIVDAERLVDESIRDLLGLAALRPDRGFFEMGMDSVTAVALARRLSDRTGLPLPVTIAFDHPNVAALARALVGHDARATPSPASTGGGPVAVVATAIRFPGASDLAELAALLSRGAVLPGPVPGARWDATAEPVPARFGAFLDDIEGFDALAFGLSPREAESLDPQQRLLLALSREAAERAGRLGTLRESRTGVFLGIADRGYLRRFRSAADLYPDAYAGTGNEPAFAAGRIAHAFGLRGPAVSLDTTCSSALVALHLAARALRAGECDQALAGAASLLLMPDDSRYLAALGALSPTGRCHAFRDVADGYVRGEGAAVFLLRRLDDALSDGDPVLAVIDGTATNHDGASAGLTVPSGPAQADVVRAALADAAWSADQVDAVEAHGTGTPLGDPIEWGALASVFGDRKEPLPIGAVKANMGHLELAAGAAGVAKAIASLSTGSMAPQPDAGTPISTRLAAGPLSVADAAVPLRRGRVLVSAFGLSGTNAVVAVRAAEAQAAATTTADPRPALLLWSGPTEASATALGAVLPEVPAPDLGRALLADRAAEAFRAFRVASVGPLAGPPDRVAMRSGHAPRVAFLCTGQGAQYAGMLSGLRRAVPAAADAFDACAAVLDPLFGRPLADLFDDEEALSRTEYTQPALFVAGWCAAAAWASVGVRPDAVAGHSAGELLAATLAGVFRLDDALRLVASRGRRMGALPSGSGMVVVHATEEHVRPLAVDGLEVADVNHPEEIVLAGSDAALAHAAAEAARRGLRTTRLRVSHAFHSAWMDPSLDGWEADVAAVDRQQPALPFACNLTGRLNGSDWTAPERWRKHARSPVLFADAVRALADDGVDLFIDLGPHPILAGMASRSIGGRAVTVASQRRGEEGELAWLRAVGSAFVAGLDVRPPWGDGPRAALPPTPLRPVPTWLPGDRVAATDPTWAVAWVRAGDGPPMGPSAAPIAASPVDVLEDVLQRVRRGPPAWWSVPGATDERPDPIAAAVWGLLRCLRAEASGRVLGQFDPGDRRMTSGPPEPEARWRGHWEVPRIQRTDAHRTPIDVDATWVVTGASGAVASAATDHLLELGVRRFHLLSRSPAAAARRLGEAGAQVHVHSVDVADAAAVARAIAAIEGPVAVLHAAGITQPRSWQDVDRATLEAVCRAKVDGSIALATALAGRDVRAFVLPSSIAAVWGGRDLAPYAAANAFAEAVALGFGGSAVAMGPWGGGGMVDDARAEALGKRGLHLLDPRRAARALLGAPTGRSVLCAVDWTVAAPLLRSAGPLPMLDAVAPPPPHPTVPDRQTRPPADPVAAIRARARAVLRLAADVDLPADRPLHELGFDSLMATELKNALLADGIDAPLGRLLGGPSVEEIAEMVRPAATADVHGPDAPDASTALWWTHVAAGLVAFALGLLVARC